MNVTPRNVRWLWTALGALLLVGLAAYAHFVLTGSYDLLIALFNNTGSVFFILMTGTEAYFAFQARSLFDPAEAMHATWTLVFLAATCRMIGAALAQVLSAQIPWNPLAVLGFLHADQSRALRDAGLVVGGPVAMALLAGGLMRVIVLERRLGILSRLTAWDRSFIAIILVFTARQLFEIGVIVFANHARPSLAQTLLWFSDPLLTLLLIQAVSIRRLVLSMGHGLVARCWGMLAVGVAFTSAGDATLWAESHGFIPVVLSPLGWFIWFFAATAYASAPCYQVEAARQAHEGSYSVLLTRG